MITKVLQLVLLSLLFFACSTPRQATQNTGNWAAVSSADGSRPVARHEAAFVAVKDKFYLLGGRDIRPVSIYDTQTKSWSTGQQPPIELHHFQPVVYKDEIYVMGAMTGPYPGETPVPDIYIYSPKNDRWRTGHKIPSNRLRGGAGVVLHNNLIYLVCGIADGHRGDHKKWLDSYNPATGEWNILPDAPRPRDHFQAVVHNNQLYALAGRTTVAATNPFLNTIGEVDRYDLASQKWITLPNHLPTLRAGNSALVLGDEILVAGGESFTQELAHAEVEALHAHKQTWRSLPPLSRGRHGSGLVLYDNQLFMGSGCGKRGGEPELDDLISAMIK